MPNQPPSDRTRAKGGPPVFNLGLSAGDPPLIPIASCLVPQFHETNPISQSQQPKKSKQTQLPPGPSPKMQNEPNSPPRPPDPRSKYAKRTQSPHRRHLAAPQLRETNPITVPPASRRPYSPIYAKRTQFLRPPTPGGHIPARPITRNKPNSTSPTAKKSETNPIYRTAGFAPPPFSRNEPNPSTPGTLPPRPCPHLCETNPIPVETPNLRTTNYQLRTKYAKQTQFPAPIVIPSVGLRSGPKPRDLSKHHRRRRFQTNKPHPRSKYAKRTQFPNAATNAKSFCHKRLW